MLCVFYVCMRFWKWELKKRNTSNAITEEQREKSRLTRSMQYKINQLEKQLGMKQQLEELGEAIAEETGTTDSVEKMFMTQVLPLFLNKQQPQQPQPQIDINTGQPIQQSPALSELQIIEYSKLIKQKLPEKYIKGITLLSDEDILKVKHLL